MHGMPSERERIAVWLVCEPFSVTIARILLLSTSAKSDGAKSELTRISGSESAPIFDVSIPSMFAITRRDTSLRSQILSRINESSIFSNASMNLLITFE